MADHIKEIASVIGALGVIIGVFLKAKTWTKNLTEATRCMLRSQILEIYFEHKGEKTITQLGFENAEYLYKAYKALGGNSFVDKVFTDIKGWDIVE